MAKKTKKNDNPANIQNPRYLAYCRAHGKTPKAMLEHDRERYPGGCMAGYIVWHSEKLNEARKSHPEFFYTEVPSGRIGELVDHTGYDKWLNASVRGCGNKNEK